MKKKVLIITTVLFVLLTSLFACNKGKKVDYSDAIKKSAEAATEMDGVMTVTDGGKVVYKYEINVIMKGTGAAVTTSESQYNSSFVFDTQSSGNEYENYDKNNFVKINYDESKFTAHVSGDTVSITVSEENFASVVNAGAYKPSGNTVITLVFSGDKLQSIAMNYLTKTGLNVSVGYTYKY